MLRCFGTFESWIFFLQACVSGCAYHGLKPPVWTGLLRVAQEDFVVLFDWFVWLGLLCFRRRAQAHHDLMFCSAQLLLNLSIKTICDSSHERGSQVRQMLYQYHKASCATRNRLVSSLDETRQTQPATHERQSGIMKEAPHACMIILKVSAMLSQYV